MAMQTIKTGGAVGAEIAKINANFALCAEKTEIPDVPTKTSDLTNDSGFITSDAIPTVPTKTSDLDNDSGFVTTSEMNTALGGKVSTETGKGLSTNDYTTPEKTKLAGLSAPEKVTFTASNWVTSGSSVTFTTTTTKNPAAVMRKDGTNYFAALVDVKTTGSSVVITSDESFEGYILLV